MKLVLPALTRLQTLLPAAAAALLLAGCGGGGGSSAATSAPTPPVAVTPAPAPAPTPTTTTSTALKDNTVASGANFDNFVSGKVSVPVDGVAFVGARRFVKVARSDGATVFLGEVAPGLRFELTVDAPVGLRRFNYEIFSESADDTIVRGEVQL